MPLDPDETQLDLLKMEYGKATERYENIYKATWQNFSYLAVLSAAILTFGAQQLAIPIAIFLSGLPMAFWFFVQFLPLDRYAKLVFQRLGEIERILNGLHFQQQPPVQHLPAVPHAQGQTPLRLGHYTAATESLVIPGGYHIRNALIISALIAFPLWLYCIKATWVEPFSITKPTSTQQPLQLALPIDTLKSLTDTEQRLNNILLQLRKIEDGKPPNPPSSPTGENSNPAPHAN